MKSYASVVELNLKPTEEKDRQKEQKTEKKAKELPSKESQKAVSSNCQSNFLRNLVNLSTITTHLD